MLLISLKISFRCLTSHLLCLFSFLLSLSIATRNIHLFSVFIEIVIESVHNMRKKQKKAPVVVIWDKHFPHIFLFFLFFFFSTLESEKWTEMEKGDCWQYGNLSINICERRSKWGESILKWYKKKIEKNFTLAAANGDEDMNMC